jgi:hypothetical protein
MPRGRILLRAVSDSHKLSLLKTDTARLLYSWLIPHVDYNGNFSGDAEFVRNQVFKRLRKTEKEVEDCLADLEDKGLILRYEANGDKFLHVVLFVEKQPHLNPDRESEATIPLPPGNKRPKKTAKPKLEKAEFEPIDMELAATMVLEIAKNNPKFIKPDPDRLKKWAKDIRMMRTIDNREPRDIRKLTEWAQTDDFWRGNIMSPAKLREHFGQLWTKMHTKKPGEKTAEELEREDEEALKDPGR